MQEIWSDYDGPQQSERKLADRTASQVGEGVGQGQAVFDYIDPLAIVEDIASLLRRNHTPWLCCI